LPFKYDIYLVILLWAGYALKTWYDSYHVYLLSSVHQTRDKITKDNCYPTYILSYFYHVLYHIMSLSYPAYQIDPKYIKENKVKTTYWGDINQNSIKPYNHPNAV
jgi:hypothetical protein